MCFLKARKAFREWAVLVRLRVDTEERKGSLSLLSNLMIGLIIVSLGLVLNSNYAEYLVS